jgi:histone deacetylase complex regulatory component SIN3
MLGCTEFREPCALVTSIGHLGFSLSRFCLSKDSGFFWVVRVALLDGRLALDLLRNTHPVHTVSDTQTQLTDTHCDSPGPARAGSRIHRSIMMRELKVEDALLYLDQVKVEFGDRPHIYNEFLDIMKTFKTQQIDTPGVIRRVSTLFQGNRRLVLGFNTFLPEGYKIELPLDGDGPPVAVFRAPGSNVAHILHASPNNVPSAHNAGGAPALAHVANLAQGHAARGPAALPPQQAHGPSGTLRGPHHDHHQQQQHQQPPQQHQPQQHQQQQHNFGQDNGMRMAMGPGAMPPQQHAQQQQQQQQQQHHQQSSMVPRQGPAPSALGQRAPAPTGKLRSPSAPQRLGPQHGGQPVAPQGGPPLQQQQYMMNMPPENVRGQGPPPPAQQGAQPEAPMEFNHAINYVTNIKKRFANEPETYKKFLEILHTYQKEQRGIKEVLDEVSELFAEHPDLLKEFTFFLPDAVQAQAKAQLDAVAKESEARKRAQAKQAIMSQAKGMQRQAQVAARGPAASRDFHQVVVPFGAAQGRSAERESHIIRSAHFGVVSFKPVRPPKVGGLTPSLAAAKLGRPTAIPELPRVPNTSETAFFQRAKEHLSRKELASDKPSGSRRHTPYTEFLKCLHLFGAGILKRDELIWMLRGLFMQGHAPKSGANAGGGHSIQFLADDAIALIKEFEEVLLGRGPYADQESTLKDKSPYGSVRVQDVDFINDGVTPSYQEYPSDYPKSLFLSHPGQTEQDAQVLNDGLLCIAPSNGSKGMCRSLELYDAVRMRRNAYEEEMFRIEDERYEVDMAIERNAQAMRQIEPFAEEVQNLREQEEKDGQPIGRLQYQLNRYTMNTIHINAIGRVYGTAGDEVLQHLARNPLIVLPIVYRRLKQKDAEWRNSKTETMERWNAITEANYEGSRDIRCHFYRRELERTFTSPILLEECKRAGSYANHPEKLRDHPASRHYLPKFAARCNDSGALLFQPCVAVECNVDDTYKDAFKLVNHLIKSSVDISSLDRERIGRIWTEFMVPWFNFPIHWVTEVARESFGGKVTSSIVKFAPGQTVVTIFGTAAIVACVEAGESVKYTAKLSFGVVYLSPSAILHAVPANENPFVRRDGEMVRDAVPKGDVLYSEKLRDQYKLLFGTENVYLLLRRFILLSTLLGDVRHYCETIGTPNDPKSSFFDPTETTMNSEVKNKRLDYAGAVSALGKVLSNQIDLLEYETICRKISKEKVWLMAALPKLIEGCMDCLTKVAREDALLYLFDYCQFRRVDPVLVRAHCFAMATDASFRIQYDTSQNCMYFSYLPRSEELRVSVGEDAIVEVEDAAMHGAGPTEDSDSDPIEEFSDEGNREAKRLRLK